MSTDPIRPGRLWYWAAALIFLVGLAGAVLIGTRGVSSFTRAISQMERISIPGNAQLVFDDGGQVIYFEQRNVGADPGLDFEVRDAAGAQVDVQPYIGDLTYTSGGVSGKAVATFDIEQQGTYEVAVKGREGSGTVAIGPSIGGGVFGLFFFFIVSLSMVLLTVF